MGRRSLRAAGLTGLLLGAACASSPPPPAPGFSVSGSPSDLRRLEGRWEGDYESAATGRSGTIVFEFRSGDTAYGDVLMMPKGAAGPVRPAKPAVADTLKDMPQMLTIQFAKASGGALVGDLAPYVDPDCECETATSFNGRMSAAGDAIEGSFTSTQSREGGRRAVGHWKVVKSRRKPE
ncbi:MAG: hypothetical protein ABI592_12750 [Acidobacteriota bacterium]